MGKSIRTYQAKNGIFNAYFLRQISVYRAKSRRWAHTIQQYRFLWDRNLLFSIYRPSYPYFSESVKNTRITSQQPGDSAWSEHQSWGCCSHAHTCLLEDIVLRKSYTLRLQPPHATSTTEWPKGQLVFVTPDKFSPLPMQNVGPTALGHGDPCVGRVLSLRPPSGVGTGLNRTNGRPHPEGGDRPTFRNGQTQESRRSVTDDGSFGAALNQGFHE